MRLAIKFNEEQMVRDDILEAGELENMLDNARESEAWGCFRILNIEFIENQFILNEGFDIQFALDQISSYGDYIENEIGEPPMYYLELMNENDYMGDDATFDYCGSYVSLILYAIQWAMEIGSYEEII